MMQAHHLNFGDARRGAPWLGRALLGLAAAVCVDAGLSYKSLHDPVKQNEVHVAKRTPAGPGAKVTAQEVAAVRETVQRLALPWDEPVHRAQSAANDKVVLTVIEPDTAKGTVTISADSKDYLAALSYVSNLATPGASSACSSCAMSRRRTTRTAR